MAHSIPFDTLRFSNSLKEVGVPAKQAERQAELMAEAINIQLSTKQDLKELESRITLKLAAITVIIPTILKILEHFKFLQ